VQQQGTRYKYKYKYIENETQTQHIFKENNHEICTLSHSLFGIGFPRFFQKRLLGRTL